MVLEKNLIIKDISQSSTNFLTTIKDTPVEHFNSKPTHDSWSAAEVVEHVVKVEYLLNIILLGNRKAANNRKPDEKIETIKAAFQDYEKKYTAYGPIIPDTNLKDKDELVIKFEKNRINLKEIIKKEDLSLICLDFNHGVFGELTVFEWIYFNIYHSERHRHQIQNIKIVQ
jgi:hypothetical protein